MDIEKYKAIIIGTGQSGKPLALDLANAGWKTAVVESHYVGGSCINYGCTPSKTMAASSKVAYLAKHSKEFGIETGNVMVDMFRVWQRKENVVTSFRENGRNSLENNENVSLIFGEASFTGPKTIEVLLKNGDKRTLKGDKIFINTGISPNIPPITGLKDIEYLTSTSIMELKIVPEHLAVLGGGYSSVEFAQMFRRFGSNVTIIQRGGRLLRREDEDVAEGLLSILNGEGIKVHFNTGVHGIKKTKDGRVELILNTSSAQMSETVSHVLVVTGMKPNTEKLKLSNAGIHTDERGFIKVDSSLETNIPDVYAMGDVKGGPAFTHISYDDYRVIRTNIIGEGFATTANRLVPYTVFTDPQLGRVGMSETDAREKGYNIKIATMPMSHIARAVEINETKGFMKVVIDADTDQILGCAVLGTDGGEIMSMIEIAMMGKLPYTTLRDAIFAHPLLSESLNNLFMTV
jgi:pyruvate/2-oxoglutarate dehydrogenase complex dihydrolipoamide dehydrogenase (E3) component